MTLEIRLARVDERAALIEVQRRASLADPAFPVQVLETPGAIDVPLELVEAGLVFVAESDGVAVGFVSLIDEGDGWFELEGLFVEPEHWRRGIGRGLVERGVVLARERGARTMKLIANPNAREFYLRCGFVEKGQRQLRFGIGLVMDMAL